MFQIKRSPTEPNPTNLNTNTALPNNYGSIRTLKDDLANLKSGKKEVSEEPLPQPPIPQPAETHPSDQLKIVSQPTSPEQKIPLSNFNPVQKEKPAEAGKGSQRSDLPSPLGSETFFQTQSPFDEKAEAPKKEPEKAPVKSSKKLVIVLSSLLILAILGGGAYYWWFFMRSSKKESAPAAPKTTAQSGKTTAPETETAENPNLKKWTLDLKADKIANKLAIERYAKNLAGAISQGKAVEVKLVLKDNQPVTPQIFSEIFDFVLPASVSEKLTSDYSLFVSYENSEPRLGAAFRLTQSGNLAESLKSEEGDLFSNLKSFYLDKLPSGAQATFNSSKYKNADIRYFNFSSPANTSLDYTVLSDKENNYFIFSTSKDSFRAILDYMSEK